MPFHPDLELYLTLFVMGGLAVIIGETLQIGAAMLAGVVYVGIGVDAFQKLLIRTFEKGM